MMTNAMGKRQKGGENLKLLEEDIRKVDLAREGFTKTNLGNYSEREEWVHAFLGEEGSRRGNTIKDPGI